MINYLRTIWRAIIRRCVACGSRIGDEGQYGEIRTLTNGICEQCWFYGDTKLHLK